MRSKFSIVSFFSFFLFLGKRHSFSSMDDFEIGQEDISKFFLHGVLEPTEINTGHLAQYSRTRSMSKYEKFRKVSPLRLLTFYIYVEEEFEKIAVRIVRAKLSGIGTHLDEIWSR